MGTPQRQTAAPPTRPPTMMITHDHRGTEWEMLAGVDWSGQLGAWVEAQCFAVRRI